MPYSYNTFPEDLGSSYYNHWMTITAYPTSMGYTGATGIGGGGSPAYTAGLFMPGGEGSSGIVFEQSHVFGDIKLANLATGAIGAAASFFGGSLAQAAVGAAKKGMAAVGHPINPGIEVIYQTTNRRSWVFSFLMAPSSPNESFQMKEIIKNLRRYAAPELEAFGLTFKAPAEFELKFYHNNRENESIPKIRRSVLSRVDANYTPTGEWSTFTTGYPVSCLLTLEFQELEIVHRKFIEQGY